MKHQTLEQALARTCQLLADSNESDWSPLSPAEVNQNLEHALQHIRAGHQFDRNAVVLEFAPTSTIQEISMVSGWHEEYMQLAKVIDHWCR